VVDIIDSHDIFEKQWMKRKKFYKSQNYKIIECSNANYNPDTKASVWTTSFEPKDTNKNTNTNTNTNITINGQLTQKVAKKNANHDVDDEFVKKNDLPSGVCFIKMKK
jgi:hypothetical protein